MESSQFSTQKDPLSTFTLFEVRSHGIFAVRTYKCRLVPGVRKRLREQDRPPSRPYVLARIAGSRPSLKPLPRAESREPRAAACANRPTHRPSYTSAVGDYRTGASEQQEQQSLEHLRVRIVLWRALVQHALVRSGRRTVTSADSPIDSR